MKNSVKGRLLHEKEAAYHIFVDPSMNTPGVFMAYWCSGNRKPWGLRFAGPSYRGHAGYKLKAFNTTLTKMIDGEDTRMWVEGQKVDKRTPNANSILKCSMSTGVACASNPRLPATIVPVGWKGSIKKEVFTEQVCYVWHRLYGTDLKELVLEAGIPNGRAHNTIDAVGLFLNTIGEIGK